MGQTSDIAKDAQHYVLQFTASQDVSSSTGLAEAATGKLKFGC